MGAVVQQRAVLFVAGSHDGHGAAGSTRRFQDYSRDVVAPGKHIGDEGQVPRGQDACAHEADLPAHEGASGAMQRLQQEYDLGDDVLLTVSLGEPFGDDCCYKLVAAVVQVPLGPR